MKVQIPISSKYFIYPALIKGVGLSVLLFFQFFCNGQNTRSNSFELGLTYAIEDLDDRFYSPPPHNTKTNTPSYKSTERIGIRLSRQIQISPWVRFGAGLGLEVEKSYMVRETNITYFTGDPSSTADPKPMRTYHKALVGLPLTMQARMMNLGALGVDGFINAQFQWAFHKTAHTYTGREYARSIFEFYRIEIIPGIRFTFKNLYLDTGVRVYQLKQIDPTIFFNQGKLERESGLHDRNLDVYNPIQISFTFGVLL